MAKKKGVNEPKKKSRAGGCLKTLIVMMILMGLIYVGGHLYLFVKPANMSDEVSTKVENLNVLGAKLFPAVNVFTTDRIGGREEVLKGWLVKAPKLKERLHNAVKAQHPVTFREEELNAWLSKRLAVKQAGLFGPYVKSSHVWVDLKDGQMDVVIERELADDYRHVTSLLIKFTRLERGYDIQPYAAQIGHVKAPGGFARLIISPFEDILEELTEELLPYKNREIYDIHVEEGKITLDPRTVENRE